MKHIPLLLISENSQLAREVTISFSPFAIDVLESKPDYTSYIKILQYLPAVVVMELPEVFHDQLHFLQIFKQNSVAAAIPVICFGEKLRESVHNGLKKIGVSHYIEKPFATELLINSIVTALREAGLSIQKKVPGEPGGQDAASGILLSAAINRDVKIDSMIRHINDTTMLHNPLKVAISLLEQKCCSEKRLCTIIKANPHVQKQFIRQVNTLFCERKELPSGLVATAISRVGLSESIRSICCIATIRLFGMHKSNRGIDRLEFWRHSIAVAVICEQLARISGAVDPKDAFIAGLLHDFGVLVMDEFFPSLFGRIVKYSVDNEVRLVTAEQAVLKVDHSEMVSSLFVVWNMPEHITNAVVYHSLAVQLAFTPGASVDADPVCVITGLANVIANAYGIGMKGDHYAMLPAYRLFSSVGITNPLPADFYETVMEKIDFYNNFVLGERLFPHCIRVGNFRKTRTVGVLDTYGYLFNPVKEYLMCCGYVVVDMYDDKEDSAIPPCDVFAIFFNSFIDETILRRLCTRPHAKSGGRGEGGTTPVMLFGNNFTQVAASPAFKGVSLFSSTLHLRELPLLVESVASGSVLRDTAFYNSLRDTDYRAERRTTETDIEEQIGQIIKYREKCLLNGAESKPCLVAETHLKQAQLLMSDEAYDKKVVVRELLLAAQYYRKAWLAEEMRNCAINTDEKENGVP